jgi:NhaP-type Na+/H+ or K+/H+ antiporter
MSTGVSLWAIGLSGIYVHELRLPDALVFGSLISAVDPVAVLAIFEAVQEICCLRVVARQCFVAVAHLFRSSIRFM